MTELDKILMTVISFVSAGLAGYIVKLHVSRTQSDKDHKDEIKSILKGHNEEVKELSVTVAGALIKMTSAMETWNRLTEKVLDRLK